MSGPYWNGKGIPPRIPQDDDDVNAYDAGAMAFLDQVRAEERERRTFKRQLWEREHPAQAAHLRRQHQRRMAQRNSNSTGTDTGAQR